MKKTVISQVLVLLDIHFGVDRRIIGCPLDLPHALTHWLFAVFHLSLNVIDEGRTGNQHKLGIFKIRRLLL